MHMKPIMEGWRGYLTEAKQDIVDLSNELLDLIHQLEGFQAVKFKNEPTPRSRKIFFTDVGGRTARANLNKYLASSSPEITAEAGDHRGGTYKGVPYSFQEGRVGKEGTPQPTKFEENLANALNSVGGACATKFIGAGTQWDALADQVISSAKASFSGQCFAKLPQADVVISALYTEHDVSSREPKTDLISRDESARISVKKDISQFISSQGNETAAVLSAVLKNIEYGNIKITERTAALIKKYFNYEQGIANLKELSPEERKRAQTKRNFFLQRIQHLGGRTLNYYLVREALLGEYKFEGGAGASAVPNYFLVWNIDGTGKLYEAERFVKYMASNHKFGVRGRGEKRGLALRGEPAE